MRTVFKYPFDAGVVIQVDVPEPGKIVDVAAQNGIPCVWIEVDPEKPTRRRDFELIGTGHTIFDTPRRWHVGTCHLPAMNLVLHVYERDAT